MKSSAHADRNGQIQLSGSGKLLVEMWLDVGCPWCGIGWARLQRALSEFDHCEEVVVVPRSFRLSPGVAPTLLVQYLAGRMRAPDDKVREMLRHVEEQAASEGLGFHLDGTLTGDTVDVHRLLQFAQSQGKGDELLVRLFRARLSEQVSIYDHDNLISIASEAGLEPAAVAAVLKSNAFRAEVDADQLALNDLGAGGVPFFRIGGEYTLSGAQPQETVAQVLRQAWEAQSADSR
ncbi:disulfide bond formation protein DsbA [Pseudomonas sp. GL93]|uniref:DsbA family oxidoreductase n=1 Tax=Pseudomonas sp. GL93 TaxID=2014741 RepID=UPI000E315938|nr:DsbA family oxidoreductase [Pseudomonas sp. GL93]RFD32521.1 disulfide bond formation protein DsbA [Pseudomonas sp. GL93]